MMPIAKGIGPLRNKTSDAKYRVKEYNEDPNYGT